MHDILKKALDEALTEKYNAELMGCADVDYSFSGGFLSDMKALIRKTDNKLIYYSKYAAIAACACVAIGCAVLLPNLLNSGISVQPSETTTTTVTAESGSTTTPKPTTESLPIIVTTSDTSNTPVSDEAAPVVSDTKDDEDVMGEEGTTVTTTTTTTTKPPVTTTEKETEDDDTIILEDEGDDDVAVEEEEVEEEIEEEEEVEEEIEEEEDDAEAEEEEEVVEEEDENDTNSDVIVEEEEEVEEEVETEEEEDVDEDVDGDVTAPAYTLPAEADTFEKAAAYCLWNDMSKPITDNLYVWYSTIYDGANFSHELRGNNVDLSFIADFLEGEKDSLRVDENVEKTGEYMIVEISDYPLSERRFYDYSKRNEYESYFYSEEWDEFSDEEDALGSEITVYIFKRGYVQIAYNNSLTTFVTDYMPTTALFDYIDSGMLDSEPKTVGDIFSTYNLTAENIDMAYGGSNGVYDINISNAKLDTAEEKAQLAAFLDKLKDRKIDSLNWKSSSSVRLDISLKDRPTYFYITLSDKMVSVTVNGEERYNAKLNGDEYKELLTLICKSQNLPEPFYYNNVEEYLANAAPKGTELKKLDYSEWGDSTQDYYFLLDKHLLAEIYAELSADFKNAEYMPFRENATFPERINGVIGASASISIFEDDIIQILGNDFTLPKGTFKKVRDLLKKNATLESYVFEDEYEEPVEEEIDE